MNNSQRPDPDSLLNIVTRDKQVSGRGALKVFFGACAGVGKTYAMLNDARQRLQENVDVVIGVVETHGRSETAKLTESLPAIPKKKIAHRGVSVEEFDIDAALTRHPGLILMDELAHTNAPGSRHPKRWQDVEELLARGIDVYTTLNVQHLESLNDLVAKFSGIQVRETVPDAFFDTANEIVLVDIPTDEILKRLKEGKVYLAEIAQKRALEHFFKKRNLIALRELALRRTAERVDAQMDMESGSQGIRDVALSDRLLVCIGHDALSTRLIRHAKRIANRMRIAWHVVYIETARHQHINEEARLNAQRNLQLAEKMGAITATLKGDRAVDEILAYAYSHGMTQILVGRRLKNPLRELISGSLAQELILQAKNIEISVITENSAPIRLPSFLPRYVGSPSGFAVALFAVATSTLAAWPFRETADSVNLVMFYLTAIVFVAARFGTGPSIMASFLSVAAFNFFFTEPYFTFHVFEPGYYFTFIVMLITSIVIGSLAARLRLQARFYREKEEQQSKMYALAKALSAVRSHTAMAELSSRYIGEVLDGVVTVYYPDVSGTLVNDALGTGDDLREKSAAQWAFDNKQFAGSGTDTLPGVQGFYIPLLAENKALGVLGIIPSDKTALSNHDSQLIEAFATIVASSLLRANSSDAAEQRRVEAEGEKLRSVILSSLSHDLRTPLASMEGAASSMLMSDEPLSANTRQAITSIQAQCGRLTRIVTNLLDITKLELGQMSLNRQPYFLEEVIGAALSQIDALREQRQIDTELEATDRLIEIDGVLIEQVFINLLENAIKFTRKNGRITIRVEDHKHGLLISVEDDGRGIPDAMQKRIFDKFTSFDETLGTGTGLGLAICHAVVTLHGGTIWADNNARGGATIFFTLPHNKTEAS